MRFFAVSSFFLVTMLVTRIAPRPVAPPCHEQVSLVKRSLFQRLFGQQPEENAIIEFNNLLASRSVEYITDSDRQRIENKYKTNLNLFSLNLQEFYAVYFAQCLRGNDSPDTVESNIRALTMLLRLDSATVIHLNRLVGLDTYKTQYKLLLKDGIISNSNRNKLDGLAKRANLLQDEVQAIEREIAVEYISGRLIKFKDKQTISPTERHEFGLLCNNLSIDIRNIANAKTVLDRLSLYWNLENHALIPIPKDLNIQKSEDCFLKAIGGTWYEVRHSFLGPQNGDFASNVKFAKDIYLKPGNAKSKKMQYNNVGNADTGTFYITNKRLVFVGEKNHILKFEKIVFFEVYENGIYLRKTTGKNIFIELNSRLDEISIILAQLLIN